MNTLEPKGRNDEHKFDFPQISMKKLSQLLLTFLFIVGSYFLATKILGVNPLRVFLDSRCEESLVKPIRYSKENLASIEESGNYSNKIDVQYNSSLGHLCGTYYFLQVIVKEGEDIEPIGILLSDNSKQIYEDEFKKLNEEPDPDYNQKEQLSDNINDEQGLYNFIPLKHSTYRECSNWYLGRCTISGDVYLTASYRKKEFNVIEFLDSQANLAVETKEGLKLIKGLKVNDGIHMTE
jgi:hypothetical protein